MADSDKCLCASHRQANKKRLAGLLPPFVWRTFAEGHVALSEEGRGAVATQISEEEDTYSLATEGVELIEGKH
jgi:hypothetical protein